jgi:hypothetical protein
MKSVGVFKLTKNTVEVKSKSPVKGDVGAADIEEVSITLAHGAIAKRGLIVTLKDGRIFLNRDAPISLASFFRRTTDLIRINDKDQTTYIKLGDLMTYVPIGKFYYPADGEFKIRADKKLVDTLRIGSTFNEYINASVYTDLLGLLGRKPNGILQTEISGNFISNAANLWSNADIVFHNFIQPYFRLSKFDSRFTQLDSSNIKSSPSKKDSVNRAYLNQIAYLIAGLKTNIVRFGIGVNQQVYLNFGIEVGLANADSIYNKDITFINWYPEITYSINKLDNFGIECSLRLLKQHIAHGSPFANNDGQTIINSQASLFYYPFSNSNNRMYLRFNYYDNVKGFAYNFSQFQLGWKTSLLTNKSSK